MRFRFPTLVAFAAFVFVRVASAGPDAAPPRPVAAAGDAPLPDGAIVRLGTTRFRTSGDALALSADGTRLAVRVPDGIDVLDLETGAFVAALRDAKKLKNPELNLGPHFFSFAFAAGGREIVTANAQAEVWMWDAITGKALRSIAGPRNKEGPAIVYTLQNCQLADFVIAETNGGWRKLNPKTGEWSGIATGHHIANVSPDGRWITAYNDMASVENSIGVIDTKRNISVHDSSSGGSYPFNSTPSPDGKLVACTTEEAGVQVWDIATGKEIKLQEQKVHGTPKFTPDSKTILVSRPDSVYDAKTPPHFARWDVASGARLADWKMPARIHVWTIDYKNNRIIAVAAQGIYRIDIATGKIASPPDGFLGEIRPALSADGKFAAVGDAAGKVRLWHAPFTGQPQTLSESGSPVRGLVFSNDGTTLFAGHQDRTATLWDVATGKRSASLTPPAEDPRPLDFWRPNVFSLAPDDRTLAASIDRRQLWVWDVPSGKVLWERRADAKNNGSEIISAAFSPDNTSLDCGLRNGDVVKVDPQTGRERTRLIRPTKMHGVTRLAHAPNGKLLAVHSYNNVGDLVLFDFGKNTAIWRQRFPREEMLGGLAFSADGDAVITFHSDGTLRGWKAADGERTFTLRAAAGYCAELQLSRDGQFAITEAPGATALVWKLK